MEQWSLAIIMSEYKITIKNTETMKDGTVKTWLYEPIVPEGVQWVTTRCGEPSKLTFTVIKDEIIKFNEGDEVRFTCDKKPIFFGYVFEKRRDKNHHIEVTCYDPSYYLKTKENFLAANIRADQVIARLLSDMHLKIKSLINTGYVIHKFAQSDKTLFEIFQDALDQTLIATGELYCLYWDFDGFVLKHHKDMITDLLICKDTAENFDYSTSINGNTFNSIVVKSDNGERGDKKQTSVYVLNDFPSQSKWGVLQMEVDVQAGTTPQQTAQIVMSMYNRVSRTISVSGALGDIRVRGGSSVFVDLYLGDHTCSQTLLVTQATHTFKGGHHSMELTLIDGRGFYGK